MTDKNNKKIVNSQLLEIARQRKEMLESELTNAKARISTAAAGSLRIARKGNAFQYYQCTKPNDTKGVYIKKKEMELAKSLAQKDYDLKLEKLLKNEIDYLNKYINKYGNYSIEQLYDGLNDYRKKLVTPIVYPTNEYVNEWKSVQYEGKPFEEMSPCYYTDVGERVRSKSEIIIANKLNKMGIPYRYEYPISFGRGFNVYPDFYCLNIQTREEYIWEHFGMMDAKEYADKAIKKINGYNKQGYWLGKNLIVTFETSQTPINVVLVEQIIKMYLL